MRKYISVLVTAVLLSVCLCACASSDAGPAASSAAESAAGSENTGGISIVTTIFPEYDWVRNILGDNPAGADLTLLLDSGVDLHSFQPAADDIMKIAGCDIFIYVGGESDEWAEDALKESVNKDMIVLNLLDILGDRAREEEVVEGMQEEEHDHEDEDHEDESHEDEDHEEEEPEYDEHVWLSLKNADLLIQSIEAALEMADPENASLYKENAQAYRNQLQELDSRYQETAKGAKRTTLLFADRFPFRYMTEDYGLSYYAAFVSCSAETEASFETITFLSQKTDELALPAVLTIEGADHKIAETVIQNTRSRDQKILTMDSMQSVTAEDAQAGAAYLSIMEKNLEILSEALN